jgi:hypothetical protein
MGHHGSEGPSEEMLRAMDALKEASATDKEEMIKTLMQAEHNPKFGATGQYPDGSLDKSDEGEIVFGITSHRGKVILNFGKPVSWLGMDARQAASLAAILIQHANQCRDVGDENNTKATAKEHA